VRLQVGIVLACVAAVAIICALPAPWYQIHVVGPNFDNAMMAGEEPLDGELRQLDGQWTLWDYELNNATFDLPPPQSCEPMSVVDFTASDPANPNANALEVYHATSAMVVGGAIAFAAAAFGAYNVARHDRFRWLTAASMLLAAILLFAAPAYFGFELPGAISDDASTGSPDAFGAAYSPYIDQSAGPPPFYPDFSGGYPNADARDAEQLEYGPGLGFYMAGIGAVLAIIAGAFLFGAPQWGSARANVRPREIYRYVPVPVVANAPPVQRYPRRARGIDYNPSSPGLPSDLRRTGIAETPARVVRYRR
jgi:hypothetical protein